MRILVQGRDAERAAAEIVAFAEGDADVRKHDESEAHRDPLSVAAAVVAIAGGSVALADHLMRWCRRWRGDRAAESGRSVERIIVIVDGRAGRDSRRMRMESLTREDLERLLGQESDDSEE
ncbi:hypothetical protein ACPB9J_31815 [Streptomyces lavendulocolor]|uniref:hypothetical protein n=1 Tax=Streptomyces lavendulocolor TaxID=67316 RepID=UPI003C3067FA